MLLCFLLDRLGGVIVVRNCTDPSSDESTSTSAASAASTASDTSMPICDKPRDETRVGSAVVGLHRVGILRERRIPFKDFDFESNSRTVAVGEHFSNHFLIGEIAIIHFALASFDAVD